MRETVFELVFYRGRTYLKAIQFQNRYEILTSVPILPKFYFLIASSSEEILGPTFLDKILWVTELLRIEKKSFQ